MNGNIYGSKWSYELTTPGSAIVKGRERKMGTLLIKNAEIVITNDHEHGDFLHGGLFVRDRVIEQIGRTDALPQEADQVIDARGLAIVPGLVNTHHHFYQTLTRAVPGSQNEELFDWLVRLYPIWGN
jgi:cytosine/adenosine deaminase-related metal-dependent hydrolase